MIFWHCSNLGLPLVYEVLGRKEDLYIAQDDEVDSYTRQYLAVLFPLYPTNKNKLYCIPQKKQNLLCYIKQENSNTLPPTHAVPRRERQETRV